MRRLQFHLNCWGIGTKKKPFPAWVWTILGVVALCLAAIRPWFQLEGVCSDDLYFHLLRLAQLESLVRQGVLYSRWAPDMALGYGFPFFNFYAPLSYYLALPLSLILPTLKIVLIAAFALATVGAGLGAYLLARDYFAPRNALVAAVAYAYAPYLAYDAYFRGNLAETAAWGLLPLALWAMGRLVQQGNRRYMVGVAFTYAAILLTHNVFALIFSPLLAAYGLACAIAFTSHGGERYRRLVMAGGAICLGLLLTTFFWLPAFVERAYVHSDRLLVPPVFVYWNNFIELGELLAAPRTVHPDLLNPSPPRALGMIHVLLGLPALLGLYRFRDRRRFGCLFFSIALLGYAWLTTASSRVVWEHVPLLEYVQFPWRLLGPAALCLAMLIAATAEVLSLTATGSQGRRSALIAGGAIVLLILGTLYWRDPRYCPTTDFGDRDVVTVANSIAQFEQASHTIGTTAKGEYLPRTVQAMPEAPAESPLALEGLPAGATFAAETRPIGTHLWITTTEPFTATYNAFAYPGWQVVIDGDPVPITPEPHYGRITFAVPTGVHTIIVRFNETPLRRWANGISLFTLVTLLGLALYFSTSNVSGVSLAPPAAPLSPGWMALGLAFLGLVGVLPRLNSPLQRLGLERLPTTHALNVSFEDGLTLLGFERAGTSIPSGGDDGPAPQGRFDLFWTAWKQPSRHYHRVITVIGPDGLRWDRDDAIPPRDFREPPLTHAWMPGFYAQDSHTVTTIPGTPPGTYELVLVVVDRETLVPLRTLNVAGQPGSPSLSLGELSVLPPEDPLTPDEIPMGRRMDVQLGPVTLLNASFDRSAAAPGDVFLATFYWWVGERPTVDFAARLALIDGAGNVAATFTAPLTRESHPTSGWRAGDLWVGRHTFHLPAGLADGEYTWRLALDPGAYQTILPDRLLIDAPQRLFTPPAIDQAVDVSLGDFATLVGASFDPPLTDLKPGQSLAVTLVWRAEGETRTSYRVFVHLVAAEQTGAPVAQSDAIPAHWGRPTTGWIAQEYVIDSHLLTLPTDMLPGTYRLQTGLYDPNGVRLTMSDNGAMDSIMLGTITVTMP